MVWLVGMISHTNALIFIFLLLRGGVVQYSHHESTAVSAFETENALTRDAVSACPLGGLEGFLLHSSNITRLLEANINSDKEIQVDELLSAAGLHYVGAAGAAMNSLESPPPVVFLKTHKTGSSTVANILHRMADIRDATVLIASDNKVLGWPLAFPGAVAQREYHSLRGQIDMIVRHSVFDRATMDLYMKPQPFYFTILREPTAQAVSAFNYFLSTNRHAHNWEAQVSYMEQLQTIGQSRDGGARYVNPQAHDLGWYTRYAPAGRSTKFDTNDGRIRDFIAGVEREVHLVMCLEQLDKSLVLLSHMLNVSVLEMAHVSFKSHDKRTILPTQQQIRRIAQVNRVDVQLYRHFCGERFDQKWAAASEAARAAQTQPAVDAGPLEARLRLLQEVNRALERECTHHLSAGGTPQLQQAQQQHPQQQPHKQPHHLQLQSQRSHQPPSPHRPPQTHHSAASSHTTQKKQRQLLHILSNYSFWEEALRGQERQHRQLLVGASGFCHAALLTDELEYSPHLHKKQIPMLHGQASKPQCYH